MKFYVQAATTQNNSENPILVASQEINVTTYNITYSDVLREIDVEISDEEAKRELQKALDEQKNLRIKALKEKLAKEEVA